MENHENESETKPLSFKPLSEGLGFHPFSDGLPYAPVSKSRQSQQPTATPYTPSSPNMNSMGTGAMAAGAPRFAPLVRRPAEFRPAPGPSLAKTISSPRPAMANPAPVMPAPMESAPSWEYLPKRFFAALFDLLINFMLCGAAILVGLWNQDVATSDFWSASMWILGGVFALAFHWALVTAQEVAFGTSLGKRFLGLRLEGTPGALLWRAVVFIPSIGLAGIGLLWGFFDSKRRCLHDIASGVQPLETVQL